jgi:hypothetical protein
MRKSTRWLALAVLVCVLMLRNDSDECGLLPSAIFRYSLHPDFPFAEFAKGRIGIVSPTFARSYLFVAYRVLAGVPFDAAEVDGLVSFWKRRMPGAPREEKPQHGVVEEWLDARGSIPGTIARPVIGQWRDWNKPSSFYVSYLNCSDDAFRVAAKTVKDRVAKWGADSDASREWLHGQDEVFANCQQGEHIPEAPAASADPLLKADREYQIAAAQFYAGHFETARTLFLAIAADRSSPWSPIAPYLAARSLVRMATLEVGSEGSNDVARLRSAETEVSTLLEHATDEGVKSAAQSLRNLIRARLGSPQYVRELAHQLSAPGQGAAIEETLWNYLSASDASARPAGKENDETDEIGDWIATFQVSMPPAKDVAVARWRARRSLPWLVAALAKTSASDPEVPELLGAAEAIPKASPAYPMLAFHRARMLVEAGKCDRAREVADELLGSKLPRSSENLVLSLRSGCARDLEDFLARAPRSVAAIGNSMDDQAWWLEPDPKTPPDPRTERPYFDRDATDALNVMPLETLIAALSSPKLVAPLRHDVALVAWTRAAVLGRADGAKKLSAIVGESEPRLKSALAAYDSAKAADAGRFAAVFLMLHFPGMPIAHHPGLPRGTAVDRIDDFRRNWWAALDDELVSPNDGAIESGSAPKQRPRPPAFLTDDAKAQSARELAELGSIGCAPNYLTSQVLEWAAAHPDDERLPEALALAVRATRYGQTDGKTGELSKRAFQLLHKRFPDTRWSKQTRFWFQ